MTPNEIITELKLLPWEAHASQVRTERAKGMTAALMAQTHHRQTGRTSRVLVNALSAASTGLRVTLRAGSHEQERLLTQRAKELADRLGIDRSNIGRDGVEFHDHSFWSGQ